MAFKRPFFVCTDIVEKVTDFMESELPLHDRARFGLHLAHCRNCRTYLAQMRATVETARTLGTLDSEPIELTPTQKELLRALPKKPSSNGET